MLYLNIETDPDKIRVRAAIQELAYAKAELNRELENFMRCPVKAKRPHVMQAMEFWAATKNQAVPMLNRALKRLGYSMTHKKRLRKEASDLGL